MSLLKPLHAQDIPLSGKHLIEASAGTGKTFNITRIYLRLLLERELTVEQILVMTFTKDATEEIRSRIGSQLRATLANWDELVVQDHFFAAIAKKVEKTKAQLLIRKALLFLDDAAIFTIHGFCKRVLSQYAFDSGLLFNMQMESSCREQALEAIQDWYRVLAKTQPNDYMKIAEYWPEPASFMQVFGAAIGKSQSLSLLSGTAIVSQFNELANQALKTLQTNQIFLFEQLVDKQKGAKKDERIAEYNQLIDWLTLAVESSIEDIDGFTMLPGAFLDGRRFARSKEKAAIAEAFAPANALKKVTAGLTERLNKAAAYIVVADGLTTISRQVTAKKQQLSLLSFDDLIEVLATKLASDQEEQLAKLLFQQFPAAMVDEFQDTDPYQFSILQNIYQHQEASALYLIGDPKQAIYGFRGGDIFTYLTARDFCQHQWVMDTNWRSSTEMITGYNRLFYGNDLASSPTDTFGYNIPYHPVASSNTINKQMLADNDKALQFVVFQPEQEKSAKLKPAFRAVMAKWLANKIVSLLSENEHITAADIAILVRDGTEAGIVKDALSNSNLSSVYLSNRSNLWHSEQAKQLLLVLRGVLYYENDRFFNAALACGLLGFNKQSLMQLQGNELAWQDIKFSFKALRDEWEHKGFISAALKLLHQHFHVVQADKERTLTNLLHMFELLQSASTRHHQPQELLFWFEQQLKEEAESDAELRLESDEQLIKIVTQHGSKGLEYPIVFVPFATRHKSPGKIGNRNVTVVNYHDDTGTLHTALEGTSEQRQAMYEESYAESVRLLYVAVTRAVQRCYMLVADFDDCHLSPLGKTLKLEPQSELSQVLELLNNQYPDAIAVETIVDQQEVIAFELPSTQSKSAGVAPALFTGKIERDWWLSSFTALSKNLRHGGVSLPDRDLGVESQLTELSNGKTGQIRFDITKGAHTGNLLHDLMEQVNFDNHNWGEVINWQKAKYTSVMADWQVEELADWMVSIVNAPLNEQGDNWTLADVPEQQTLKEQEFYFPMAKASSHKLAQILINHRRRIAPESNQSAVKLPAYQQLKGMMHGFIDLVFEHQGKYYVCDYKSTHLGNSFVHYQPQRIQQDIAKNYYDLQYLIYSLALHRLLKSRIADYDPQKHFGGAYYLYLRGMAETDQQGSGVFYVDITVDELNAMDNLFAGEEV